MRYSILQVSRTFETFCIIIIIIGAFRFAFFAKLFISPIFQQIHQRTNVCMFRFTDKQKSGGRGDNITDYMFRLIKSTNDDFPGIHLDWISIGKKYFSWRGIYQTRWLKDGMFHWLYRFERMLHRYWRSKVEMLSLKIMQNEMAMQKQQKQQQPTLKSRFCFEHILILVMELKLTTFGNWMKWLATLLCDDKETGRMMWGQS